MCEDPSAKGQHDLQADPHGDLSLPEGEAGIHHRHAGRAQRQRDNQVGIVTEDAPVDQLPVDEGINHPDGGIQHHEPEKKGKDAGIGARQLQHPRDRAGCDLVLEHGFVLPQ